MALVDRRRRRLGKVTPERRVAFRTIERTFREDAFTDRAFAAEVEREQLDPRQRAQAQWMAYGAVRRARTIDHVIARMGKRPLTKLDAVVHDALRLGVFQLMYGERGDDHAIVDQTVELVRGLAGERPVAFANAVMRRAAVDWPAALALLDGDDLEDVATRLSMPNWAVSLMHDDFGQRGLDALAAQDNEPETTSVRWNPVRGGRDELERELTAAGANVVAAESPLQRALADNLVLIEGATAPVASAVDRGAAMIQSTASMLVVDLLAPEQGERVLDMCAAPGGKTTDIAARVGASGQVDAVELHERRAVRMQRLCESMGLTWVTVQVGDARSVDLQPGFDRVLVDAPCSGLGVVGRRPDLRWKRGGDGVTRLADLQYALVARAAELVRPGGVVVYSTCTLTRAENEDVIARIVADGVLAARPIPDRLNGVGDRPADNMIRLWPQDDASDGFTMALLERADG